ncbi:MAG: enoyl-CoA hydratase/isomerase family protein [Alphaproteobacteria bacterium]|nr:enoyl-CoA hydratase/isomerase family protein [Alphaproteobacteria bacterium]
MATKHVTVERAGAVAIVRFERADCRNAFSLALIEELTEAADTVAGDRDCGGVVLTGGGGVFTAGLDLRDPGWRRADGQTLEAWRTTIRAGNRLCAAWAAVPQCTVAAIEGYAVGGGLALALALDWRVMGRSAFVTLPEIEIGLNLGWGAIPRLTALVGPARAKRAAILCQRIAADEALRWGLIDDAADDGEAADRAVALAERAASMPVTPARMTKKTVDAFALALAPLAEHMDGDQGALTFESPEFTATLERFARR